MLWLWTGFCLFLTFRTGDAGINSLDRFNDEDIAEFGVEPQKPMDRGLIMDRIFNKRRMQPGNAGVVSQADTQVGGSFGSYANSNSGFGVTRGNQNMYGLNYGSNNAWGGNFGAGGNTGMSGNYMGPFIGGYNGPYAGPPMFIQPAQPAPAATAKPGEGGDGATTTASPDGTTGGPTTMRPYEKAEAIVRAFGGGEKSRIQQMGPPIIVPMDQAPVGLKGVGKMPQKPIVVKPGEQMPMYGRIVLGPAKFAQTVDMNAKAQAQTGGGLWNKNSGGMTLVRFNRPDLGVGYNNNNEVGGNYQVGGETGRRVRGGFRSLEPYNPPVKARAPPVIKYVPVVETVRRRRMKGVLVDPETGEERGFGGGWDTSLTNGKSVYGQVTRAPSRQMYGEPPFQDNTPNLDPLGGVTLG